jgi:hypothetical protein
MDEESQNRLLKYVEDGGNLVCFSPLPCKSLTGMRTHTWDDKVPTLTHALTLGYESKLLFADEELPLGAQKVLIYDLHGTDFEPVKIGSLTVGGIGRIGRGRLILLGVSAFGGLVRAVHRLLGVPIYSWADEDLIYTSVHKSVDGYTIFAVNIAEENRETLLHLDTDALQISLTHTYSLKELTEQRNWDVTGEQLAAMRVSLPPKDGRIYRIREASVKSASEDRVR